MMPRLVTLAVLTLLFAAFAAWPVPDVNEAVYLTKARHFADPTWGRGDFFLETRDAHGGFFILFGRLLATVPLETGAWICRWIGWLAVAAGFRHAVVPLAANPHASPSASRDDTWRTAAFVLVAGGLFAVALRATPMAGEWLLGGCEAKVCAWACVLAGIGEVARGRWASGVCAMGAGTWLHVLVGGWGMVALVGARLMGRGCDDPCGEGGQAPGPRWSAALFFAAGIGLAAAGVVPALGLASAASDADRAAAIRIYVVERLPHHLLPRTFAEPMVARHLLAIAVWWLLTRLVQPTPPRRRLVRFTLAVLAISLAGWLISLAEPLAPARVLALLRYYWFRLGDVVVPFALAVSGSAVTCDAATCRRVAPLPPWVVRTAVVLGLVGGVAVESAHWPLPGRTGLVPRADSKVAGPPWIDICAWVRDHTPADACFLTPRGAASFTWRTERREVVSWKNSPQDVAGLLEWRRRIIDCFSADGSLADMERSTAALGAQRLREVADRYGAEFAIVPADVTALADLPFPVLHTNGGYVVLDLRDTR